MFFKTCFKIQVFGEFTCDCVEDCVVSPIEYVPAIDTFAFLLTGIMVIVSYGCILFYLWSNGKYLKNNGTR